MLVFRHLSATAVIFFCLLLVGCGGGGSGSQPAISLSVSPASISVSVDGTAPEPITAAVQGKVSRLPSNGGLYIGYSTNDNGVNTLGFAKTGSMSFKIDIEFKSPTQLNQGTYRGVLDIEGCLDKACKNQISNSPQKVNVSYTVKANPAAVLASISPSFALPGSGAFTLTAQGSKFIQGATVDWNGNALTTEYISSSRLMAAVPATNVNASGTAEVTVVNPKPSTGPSNALSFPIRYSQPSIGNLFPNAVVAAGRGFTLTVVGSGFGPGSQVRWNDTPKTTHYVSGAELTAQVNAADIASVGTAAVTVYDPTPGTSSAPATLAINPATSSAVSFQINASHSGDMNFDPVSFPATSTWSTNVGGEPYSALIADGEVFVTANDANAGTLQLFALDQKTGAVIWGPIPVSNDAAYGAGSLFIDSDSSPTSGIVRAYDAATGSLEWSTQLTGQYDFSSAPVAHDGFVYVIGDGMDGTLYALDESDGSLVWTESVYGGSIPAVTADGIYVSGLCHFYDFRPGTGELVWNSSPAACNGTPGEGVPAVADGMLYGPYGGGNYNGEELDAETGSLIGPYTADNAPAMVMGDGYFLRSGILYGIDLSNNSILWSFAGDGNLMRSPIVVNQYVIVGSSSGNLYALDRTTGQQAWQVKVDAILPTGTGPGGFWGLVAGHGLLIVRAGNSVIAYRVAKG